MHGKEYTGNVSITSTGKQCQPWAVSKPHHHTLLGTYFPENSLQDVRNFCRNPHTRHASWLIKPQGPWCFTMDPETEWEYCDVPNCGVTEIAVNIGEHSVIFNLNC